MTFITENRKCLSLINVFLVRPENQEVLIGLLNEATERVMRFQPGFISANIHRGLDGSQVANYAQWESYADFDRAMQRPEVKRHLDAILRLVETNNRGLFHVAKTHERERFEGQVSLF